MSAASLPQGIKQIRDIEAIAEPRVAELLLHPLRQRILSEAVVPASAAAIARRVGLAPQKVNYHVRTLVEGGLLLPAGERSKRNLVEKQYRATARAYVLLPDVLGPVGALAGSPAAPMGPARVMQMMTAVQAELAPSMAGGGPATPDEELALALDGELRIHSEERHEAFRSALIEAVRAVVDRFAADPDGKSEAGAPDPRRPDRAFPSHFRVVVASYPIPSPASEVPTSAGG